ncbi:MAG: class I SAM-dependent methyltransferase [Candidatus Rokubacteria bacterium]|nr:class I SAM-dependent methyltransferase [Candidatus Rokubacteria bacterium]
MLDFGAGSCWVSAILNRMGCRTIAIDVSSTAIAIGRKCFELDQRTKWHLNPEFLTYDGYTFPIAANSVDRIVCFDAFHHVPNPQAILNEMFRVLKDGGRVGFSEVGEGHSHTPQAISEMQAHGILENDFLLEQVHEEARRVGFTKCTIHPYPLPTSIGVGFTHYRDFLNGDDQRFPLDTVRRDTRANCFITLQKGDDVCDSRNPRTLAADVTVIGERIKKASAGGEVAYVLRIVNTGDTTWLSAYCQEGGFVDVGGHLLDASRHMIDFEYLRAFLPADVAPNHSVMMDVKVRAPLTTGAYFIEFDMVDEAITWFAARGSKTARVKVVVE